MARGKRYKEAVGLIDGDAAYAPAEAIDLTKKTAKAKFDETIELHLRTGADPRYADQMVRGVAVLPHGVGKPVRVLVFCQGEAEAIAREAGADFVGSDELIKEIQDGFLGFDVSIATPDLMGRIGRLGRILGQARPHAESQNRHGGAARRYSSRRSGRQEGASRIQAGQNRTDSRPDWQGQLRGRNADGQPDHAG